MAGWYTEGEVMAWMVHHNWKPVVFPWRAAVEGLQDLLLAEVQGEVLNLARSMMQPA